METEQQPAGGWDSSCCYQFESRVRLCPCSPSTFKGFFVFKFNCHRSSSCSSPSYYMVSEIDSESCSSVSTVTVTARAEPTRALTARQGRPARARAPGRRGQSRGHDRDLLRVSSNTRQPGPVRGSQQRWVAAAGLRRLRCPLARRGARWPWSHKQIRV
jgi:hypothetical protein